MAIRKNPPFSVWLTDVWFWASRPPGIYFCIIGVLVCALLYSFSSSQQSTISKAERDRIARIMAQPPVPLAPPRPSGPMDPSSPRYNSPSLGANSGCASFEVLYFDKCIVVQVGSPNNCPDDQMFIDKLGGCIRITDSLTGIFQLFPGNAFLIEGRRPTTVTALQGGAVAIAAPVASDGYAKTSFITEGNAMRFVGPWKISTTLGARLRITYE